MKKAVSILLSIIILSSCLIISTNAAGNATLTMGSASGKAGDTVSLDIELTGNPGLIAIYINVSYDSNKLKLNNVKNGTVFDDSNAVFGNNLSMVPYTMYWYDGTTHTNIEKNGVLGTVDFVIPENAPAGEIDVSLTYSQPSTFNVGLNDVPLNVVSGKVIVESEESPDDTKPTIAIDDITSAPGEEFDVPVMLCNNPGVVAIALDFSYDSSVIELIDVDYGDVFESKDTVFGNDWTLNPYRVMMFDAVTHSDYYSNGVLCIMKFRVKDTAALSETMLNISYNEDNVFNVDLNNVHFETKNAKIKIAALRSKGEAVIDYSQGVIYGLDCGIKTLENYVYSADESLEISYETTENGFGTGTKVHLKKEGKVTEEYMILIFGDVTGDGFCNGEDAVIINCLESGLLTAEDAGALICNAADCDHNKVINSDDSQLTEKSGLFLVEINQLKKCL